MHSRQPVFSGLHSSFPVGINPDLPELAPNVRGHPGLLEYTFVRVVGLDSDERDFRSNIEPY